MKTQTPTQPHVVKRGIVLNVLERVLALLSEREHWIKGKYAVDSTGEEVHFRSSDACKFCLAGAVLHVSARYTNLHEGEMLDASMTERGVREAVENYLKAALPPSVSDWERHIIGWNDRETTKHRSVVSVLKRAIAQAKKEASHDN